MANASVNAKASYQPNWQKEEMPPRAGVHESQKLFLPVRRPAIAYVQREQDRGKQVASQCIGNRIRENELSEEIRRCRDYRTDEKRITVRRN